MVNRYSVVYGVACVCSACVFLCSFSFVSFPCVTEGSVHATSHIHTAIHRLPRCTVLPNSPALCFPGVDALLSRPSASQLRVSRHAAALLQGCSRC